MPIHLPGWNNPISVNFRKLDWFTELVIYTNQNSWEPCLFFYDIGNLFFNWIKELLNVLNTCFDTLKSTWYEAGKAINILNNDFLSD